MACGSVLDPTDPESELLTRSWLDFERDSMIFGFDMRKSLHDVGILVDIEGANAASIYNANRPYAARGIWLWGEYMLQFR
jgi:hypothetical protein